MVRTLLVVQEATDVLLRHLESLPSSERAEQLLASVHDCLREAGRLSSAAPNGRERDELMMRVLALYVEITKLERSVA